MGSQHAPVTALLLGRDHTDLEAIAVEALGQHTAIALSRGRFPKGYPSTEPNEDAVFAATDSVTTMLAVADGHGGFDAAETAIQAVADAAPEALTSADPAAAATALITAAHARIADRRTSARFPDARTTLTVALVRDDAAWVACVGDSPALLVRGSRVRRLPTTIDFLGPATMPQPASSRTRLRPGDWVVIASDGLVDFLGATWRTGVAAATSTDDGHEVVRRLVAAAHGGGAGDNVAVATLRAS